MITAYKNATKPFHLLLLHEQLQETNYLINYYTNKHYRVNRTKRFLILNHLKEHKRITTAKCIAQFFLDCIRSCYYV